MKTVTHGGSEVNRSRHQQWQRPLRAEAHAAFEILLREGFSERKAAESLGLARSTVQSWRAHAGSLDSTSELVSFLESPTGLAFLQQLTHALHLVFVELGGCGIRLVCKFLALTRLDRFVASSYESQRRLNVEIENSIVDFGRRERERLASKMPEKDITVAQDETFTSGLTLVAIEPESGYILLEEPASSRDAESWKAAMDKACAGFNCRIIQSTSDEAKGLIAYAESLLGVQHSPDLFHVQQELSRGVSPPLSAKLRAAERQVEGANASLAEAEQAARDYLKNIEERGPGRPPDLKKAIEEAKHLVRASETEVEKLKALKDKVTENIKGLGNDYHPVDLKSGKRCDGSIISEKLQKRIDSIRAIAESEGLVEHSLKRIDKAERVLPKMADTIDFVSNYVRQEVQKLGLTHAEAHAFHAKLLPAGYLDRLAGKTSKQDGQELREKAIQIIEPLYAEDAVFANWTLTAREGLKLEAERLARVFQRSSSSVEGRNGVLSFRNHGLRGIPTRKRQCLTVLHNFFIERGDGTTAAERFFGDRPGDLFQEILAKVDVPRRPRSPALKVA